MPRATSSSDAAVAVGTAERDVPDTGEHLDRHDLDVECDARRADAVVGALSDRAADVGAVAVEVERRGAAADEIARRDEPRRRAELGRRGVGYRDAAEGWIAKAFDREGSDVGGHGGVRERHAGIDHRDDDG